MRYKLREHGPSPDPRASILHALVEWSGLSIDVSTVSNLHHGHRLSTVIHFKEDSEVTLPKSISVPAGEFLTPLRSRFLGEVLDSADDATSVLGLEILQFLYRRRFDPEIIVCHGASGL